mmetsp:Transcript_3064/g.3477  ORF Transcript_3064/g.3477 Transcript_3064/m.3477 type:complete len:199 (-) Transcript_3064:20-616(-)
MRHQAVAILAQARLKGAGQEGLVLMIDVGCLRGVDGDSSFGRPKMARLRSSAEKLKVKRSQRILRCTAAISAVLLWQRCNFLEGFCNARMQSRGQTHGPSSVDWSESSTMRFAEASGKAEDAPKYADDVMPDVTGAVRLYATHTLCISCLACCCQFKRLLPNVKLEVAFDVWRETRRWVGSGEEVLARFEAQEEQDSK